MSDLKRSVVLQWFQQQTKWMRLNSWWVRSHVQALQDLPAAQDWRTPPPKTSWKRSWSFRKEAVNWFPMTSWECKKPPVSISSELSEWLACQGDHHRWELVRWFERSPAGIKRQNVWTQVWKCSICSIFVTFWFFIHFWAVVYAWSVKRINFWFCGFLQPKNQYGWHGEIGVWLYKWLYSSKTVDFCWRMYIEKM